MGGVMVSRLTRPCLRPVAQAATVTEGQNQENQEKCRVIKQSLDDREATLDELEWKGRSGAGWFFFSWSRRDMEEERKIPVT